MTPPMLPARRWLGGANVPTLGGARVNAGMIFAELAITGDTVEVRIRGPFRKMFGAETLTAKPADLLVIFPIRSVTRFRGIGFRRPDGREYYFKTFRSDEILNTLSSLGFPVSAESQKATKIWGSVP